MHLLPLIPVLLAVAFAAPAPQVIDFEVIDEQLPETSLIIPVTARPTIISYDPTAAIESVEAEATPLDNSKRGTPIENSRSGTPANKRRDTGNNNSGCNACQPQPTTQNYLDVNVATDTEFLADANIAAAASNAATPSGYTKVFTNLKAASNGYVYMGYEMLSSASNIYDPATCATKCNSMPGCAAFNIFVERNPKVDACSSTCQNPPAFANVKCSYWGGALTTGSAVNNGQWRNNFHVVIAGSNGYNVNTIPPVPGYSTVQVLDNAAINAPRDCNDVDTYMGYKLFTDTPFDIRLCAAACDAQTAYNIEHPPSTGKPRLCNYWNTYLLDRNGISQGQYCSMYTEAWDNSYATNVGQYRDNDHYTISSSYSSYNVASPGYPVCPSDIAYLNSEGSDFCTSFNHYVAPHTLEEVVGTVSKTSTVETTLTVVTAPPTETHTVTQTVPFTVVTAPVRRRRNAAANITPFIADGQLEKRTVVATPASITGWQSSRISEACSQVATGTITDTTTTSIKTIYVATVTDIATSYTEGPTPQETITVTVTATPTTPAGPTIPGIILSQPTAIAGNTVTGATANIDDSFFPVTLPFEIGVFGSLSNTLFVTSNGFIVFDDTTLRSPTNSWWVNTALPSTKLPDVAICGFWDDLYIYRNTKQGIYYQIDGESPDRTVSFEFYESAFNRPTQYFHFVMIFYENNPGYVRNEYYQVSLNGISATVGAQKKSTSEVLRHSFNQAIIQANSFVILDTINGVTSTGPLDV